MHSALPLPQAVAAIPQPTGEEEGGEAVVTEGEACKNNGCKAAYSKEVNTHPHPRMLTSAFARLPLASAPATLATRCSTRG